MNVSRVWRWSLRVVAALIAVPALVFSIAHVALLQIPERRSEIQTWINGVTGLDVRLGKLKARWRWSGPEIYASGVEVFTPHGELRLAKASSVGVRVDIWKMMTHAQLLAGRARLNKPEIRLVRTVDGRIELEGQSLLEKSERPWNSDTLPSGWVDIEDARVTLIDASDGQMLARIKDVHLVLERDRDTLAWSGGLQLQKELGGALRFSGAVTGRLDNAADLTWRADVDGRDLHLAAWLPLFGERWKNLNPEGEIAVLTASVTRGVNEPFKVKAATRFSAVGFDAMGRMPGLRGLSGEITASETTGIARLRSSAFVFSMPYRFRTPITAEEFNGEVSWQREAAPDSAADEGRNRGYRPWRFSGKQLHVKNAHVTAVADVDVVLPGDGSSPLLKLQGHFRDAVLREGWRYLPIDKFRNKKTVGWLDAAFLSGRAPAGDIVVAGPTRRFPYRDGDGEFRIAFVTEGLKLHYAKGWPDIENLNAEVEFHNAGLKGVVRSGSLNGLAIEAGSTAEFADLARGELKVKGRAHGDLGDGLAYVQGSPIGPTLGGTFMKLHGEGSLDAGLDLFLPIKKLAERQVKVSAKVEDAQVQFADTDHRLRNVRGTLNVNNKQVTGKGLTASYLGGPARIDVAVEGAGRRGALDEVIRVRAQTPAAALVRLERIPDVVGLGGTVDWRGTLRLPIPSPAVEKRPITARVESSLVGASIGLPAPLMKAAEERRPLQIDIRWPSSSKAVVDAVQADLARAQLELTLDKSEEWRLTRGAVQFAGGELRLPETGLNIGGTLDTLDVSPWIGLRAAQSSAVQDKRSNAPSFRPIGSADINPGNVVRPGKQPLSAILRSIDLQVRDLRAYGFHWANATGRMTSAEKAWRVTVDAPEARGTLTIPYDLAGPDPMIIKMTRLTLDLLTDPTEGGGRTNQAPQNKTTTDPRNWPSIEIAVDEFQALSKKFGALQARLVRTPNGLELRSMSTQAPTFLLAGSGVWTADPQGQQSRLALELSSTDVLQTLRDLSYGESLTGKKGHAALNLSWSGVPDGQLLSRLNGSIGIAVDDGQVLAIQPGAGRVLGLTSVATLRRRLALDFRDLTDKGLAFDDIRGDFTLKNGDAFTSNLLLKGPAAEIGIVGRTGLVARDYDQTAVVTGNLGQTLPLAGALAGGPAIGAAVLLFSQIFKQPLKGIARGYYRITGPWEDPVVQRVDADEIKKADPTP